jgi:hypothetical protein
MNELQKFLERQAAWQKRRAALSWPEKIRLAAAVRDGAAHFRGQHGANNSAKRVDPARPK